MASAKPATIPPVTTAWPVTGPTTWPVAALPSDKAATYLGFSSKTLANWRALGEGPRYARLGKSGARIVYRIADLDQYLADHVIGSAR